VNNAAQLSAEQERLLDQYLNLLLQANETMNLTGVTERAAAQLLHIADALTLLPFLPEGRIKLADIGSGGGSPAFPVAIARPDAMVICIESTQKKAAFLKRTAAEMGLKNVSVFSDRAEKAVHLRRACDVVTARAVGTLEHIAELGLWMLKPGGKLLAMKGQKIAVELPAAKKTIARLGGGAVLVHPVDLPGADSHVVVEVRKGRKS
jgi:16S rRNA (guanine527-N7)-methyltransferase